MAGGGRELRGGWQPGSVTVQLQFGRQAQMLLLSHFFLCILFFCGLCDLTKMQSQSQSQSLPAMAEQMGRGRGS